LPLPLLLHGREAFGFLGPSARRLSAFAADKECDTSHQANDLKVLHVSKYTTDWLRL